MEDDRQSTDKQALVTTVPAATYVAVRVKCDPKHLSCVTGRIPNYPVVIWAGCVAGNAVSVWTGINRLRWQLLTKVFNLPSFIIIQAPLRCLHVATLVGSWSPHTSVSASNLLACRRFQDP